MTKLKWLLLALAILSGIGCWRLLQPTEIIDVHYKADSDSYYAIVKNLPVTDRGKIRWWEENKVTFLQSNHIPADAIKYSIGFWYGEYKQEPDADQGSDLLCFNDMESKKNCIEKNNQPLKVWYRKDKNETTFLFDNWERTYVKKEGTP